MLQGVTAFFLAPFGVSGLGLSGRFPSRSSGHARHLFCLRILLGIAPWLASCLFAFGAGPVAKALSVVRRVRASRFLRVGGRRVVLARSVLRWAVASWAASGRFVFYTWWAARCRLRPLRGLGGLRLALLACALSDLAGDLFVDLTDMVSLRRRRLSAMTLGLAFSGWYHRCTGLLRASFCRCGSSHGPFLEVPYG